MCKHIVLFKHAAIIFMLLSHIKHLHFAETTFYILIKLFYLRRQNFGFACVKSKEKKKKNEEKKSSDAKNSSRENAQVHICFARGTFKIVDFF